MFQNLVQAFRRGINHLWKYTIMRLTKICEGESPVGSSVITTCSQMAKIALDKFPRERTIDWDESKSVFDLPDPYLMFYLRWSGRLRNTE